MKLDILMLSLLIILSLPATWMGAKNYSNDLSTVSLNTKNNTRATQRTKAYTNQVVETLSTYKAFSIPKFGRIHNTKEKKKAFFDFMRPLVIAQNKALLILRKRIKSLENQAILNDKEKKFLIDIGKRYKTPASNTLNKLFFTQLLDRIDIIPVSLALAQSANESAWGTSRFAQEGNNLFGQWCFSKGCGLVPAKRPSGETYEVRKFASVSESIKAYMFNLNTHRQYENLRAIRAAQRSQGKPVTGPILAKGLQAYSIRGKEYVNDIIAMITNNHLFISSAQDML